MKFNTEKYYLKSVSFFDSLSEKEQELAKNEAERKEFKKGQIIFRQGSYSKGVFIVKKGKIKISQTSADGKESILYIYKKGDYFGYRPLLCNDPQPVSAAAVDQVVVTYIPADVFMKLLSQSNVLARNLLNNLSREFSVWINKLSVFAVCPVKERIAISLLIFNEIYHTKENKQKYVSISINRNDFASYVGTAKENLVRILRVFKNEKIIATKRTVIHVLKPEALEQLLNGVV